MSNKTPSYDRNARAPRVLYIDHTAQIGGGEIALLNLAQTLNHDAYQPVVLLFSDGPFRERLSDRGIETHVLPLSSDVGSARKDDLGFSSLLRIRQLLYTIAFTIRLCRWLAGKNFAIIHTNSLKADIVGGIAGRLMGIPVIWHVRDRIDEDYLPRSVVFTFRILARWIPDHVVANSTATLQTLHLPSLKHASAVYSGMSEMPRFEVVHDGAHDGANDCVDSARHCLRPTVGLVGRISPWKGQHIFIEAADHVRRQFPNVRFQIIGAPLFNEKEYEEKLHELVAALNLGATVDFLGFRKDVPALIRQLDVLVHASTTGEPFGQVIVEGMAAGKPVVATDGGGVPEIVVDGDTGLLVPMGDATAMADAIVRFLVNPEFRHQAGLRGRARVLDHFTIQHTVGKMQRVYDEVLNRQSERERDPFHYNMSTSPTG